MTATVVAVEAAFVAALAWIGLVFLRGVGIEGVARYVLAFVAGALVYVASLVLLVVAGLPSTPIVALVLGLTVAYTVAYAVGVVRRRTVEPAPRARPPYGADTVRDATAALAYAALVVLALPVIDAVTYIKHVDSFEYLAISGMLSARTFDEGVSLFQLQKRQLVVPALHAPARYADAFYMRSVTPAIALSTLLFIAYVAAAPHRGEPRAWRHSLLVVIVGFGLLVTHNRFAMHAFYINGHLIYALLSLVVVGSAWLLARRCVGVASGWSVLAALAMAVLQVTRVEGFVLSTAVLVAVLTSQRVPFVFKASVLAGYGIGTVVWHGFLVSRGVTGLEVVGPLVVGILALLVLSTLRWTAPLMLRYGARLRAAYVVGLLLVLGVLAAASPAIMRDSWRAFIANAVALDGYWGLGLVSVTAAVVAAGLLLRERDRVLVGLPIIAFLPQALLIAYLRDAAYRVAGGDSLNRMLIQVVPLMVMFVVVSLHAPPSGPAARRSPANIDGEEKEEVPNR
jgi:hypothetical protein